MIQRIILIGIAAVVIAGIIALFGVSSSKSARMTRCSRYYRALT
jgi:hypothetical protein